MLNSLLTVRKDAKKRFSDIQTLLDILDENEKVDSQLILKSTLMLMLYNAVEGTISNLLEEIFEVIIKKKLSVDKLPNKLQNTIYTYHLKQIGDNQKKLMKFSNYDSVEICNISYLEINKYLKLFSGNLDSKAIREVSEQLGINLPKKIDEPCLLKVKNSRNKLAHGKANFCNACQDITLDEMKDLCRRVETYLENVISAYEDFIERL